MRKYFICLLLLFIFENSGFSGEIDLQLRKALAANDTQTFHVIIKLRKRIDEIDIRSAKNIATFRQAVQKKYQQGVISLCKELTDLRHISNFRCFWLVNAITATANNKAIQEILLHPQVEVIYLDKQYKMIYPQKSTYTRQWGTHHIEATTVSIKGIRGEKVVIAILDTGIDLQHPQLRDKIILEKSISYVTDEPTPYDGNGHGTHCAGIVSSNNFGVAINARLISIKILNRSGMGRISSLLDTKMAQ